MANISNSLQKIIALAKRRGFIYPGSEIYGGLANTYDYGPVGAELLRNIRNMWWESFVHRREDIVGLESSIISHQEIWKASGHTSGFSDALVDCKKCKLRMRADHLIEDHLDGENVEGQSTKELDDTISKNNIKCPNCAEHDWTQVRRFNLLFPVNIGIIEGDQGLAYLRGETAQGMFTNFKNVIESTRVKLPFGIAQSGKSFRNEITPGNSIFRTLEFDQGEIEYFFDPDNSNWEELFDTWKKSIWTFITKEVGISSDNLRWREHSDKERSFYSKKTEDLEYNFPFGFKELWGLAYRTNYDLSQHEKGSGKELRINDPKTNKKILPHVIEPAVGMNRIFLMILCDAYREEKGRVYLSLNSKIAPYKVAVFPLLANKKDLVDKARKLYKDLSKDFVVAFDGRGNIGKRYLYQDEIGTPFCVTVDFESLEDDSVTIRHRDTMKQERVNISQLKAFFINNL